MTPKLKNLPIGVSTFESIIKSDILYVDKTEQIYNLLRPNSRYFFSRPRRFGKSLTCSTLDALFSGKKELFKDLWIGQEGRYTWEKHPIVKFDFNRISHQNAAALVKGLHSALNATAKEYEITLGEKQLSEKFAELITSLAAKHGPVVVIIDEYDKPLLDLIDEPEQRTLVQKELRNFYGTLKGDTVDAVLHFLFITGVSKFSKISLFSELNNLMDITIDEKFAALVGYTQQEVEKYFEEYIQVLAQKEERTYASTVEKLKRWYNGFRFSESKITVYNPFSLHNCFSKLKFKNYWFVSGTPNFLMKMIAQDPAVVRDFIGQEIWEISAADMEKFSLEVYYEKILTLLLQTGYLTIKSYEPKSSNYTIDYPNHEVCLSMTEQIMEYVAHIPSVKFGKFQKRFADALEQDNIDEYCRTFRDFLKLIPHDIITDREAFFQENFYSMGLLADPNIIRSEVATDRGYVDIVLHGANKIFVMEFKKDKTPDIAMKQILAKKYYEKFVIESNGPVVLVGINFDLEEEGVEVDWIIKEYDQLTELEKTGQISKKSGVRDERSLEIARNMLAEGSTIEFIAKVTGLTLDEVKKL